MDLRGIQEQSRSIDDQLEQQSDQGIYRECPLRQHAP